MRRLWLGVAAISFGSGLACSGGSHPGAACDDAAVESAREGGGAAVDAGSTGDASDVVDAINSSDGAPGETADETVGETPVDAGFVIAPHPALPQVRNQGGPVATKPTFTAVTYDGYDLRAPAEDVVATIGASATWQAATSEYGVGAGAARAPIHLAAAAPVTIDDTTIQTWLTGQLDGTHPEYGTPTSNSIYVVFYPTGTTVTNATLLSCQSFGGYHSSVWVPGSGSSSPGTSVPYVVIPECAGTAGALFSTETSTSHELIEAATDPFGTTKVPGVAWSDVDTDHLVWQVLLGGGEVTDLCQLLYGARFIPFPYAHGVQRSWSNAAALGGHDPCAPSFPGEVYFAAAGVLPDTVTLKYGGVDNLTKGVLIPVGQSRTIEVDLYSDAPAEPWTVSATDMSQLVGGQTDSLTFSWDATTGPNGTKLRLTITVVKGTTLIGGQPFMITSSNGPRHEWFGYVAQE
jgi:hypothetical protein